METWCGTSENIPFLQVRLQVAKKTTVKRIIRFSINLIKASVAEARRGIKIQWWWFRASAMFYNNRVYTAEITKTIPYISLCQLEHNSEFFDKNITITRTTRLNTRSHLIIIYVSIQLVDQMKGNCFIISKTDAMSMVLHRFFHFASQ